MALALNEVLHDLAIHETPPSQLLHRALPFGKAGRISINQWRSRFAGKAPGSTDPDWVGKPQGQLTPIVWELGGQNRPRFGGTEHAIWRSTSMGISISTTTVARHSASQRA